MQALTEWDGEYLMHDKGTRVAVIRQVEIRRPTGMLWRSVTGDPDPARRELIGYFPSLEMAAAVTWRLWVQRMKPPERVSLG